MHHHPTSSSIPRVRAASTPRLAVGAAAILLTITLSACSSESDQTSMQSQPADATSPDTAQSQTQSPADTEPATPDEPAASGETEASASPPPRIQEWMDRLTVEHNYDPETGFIVARETIALPPVIADSPALDRAIPDATSNNQIVIAFATADRCAPCQQYKKDALNDPRVIARLAEPTFIATHVEVDKQPELADEHLGSRGIPMTYALRDGVPFAVLRGQRSPEDLLNWLESLPASTP